LQDLSANRRLADNQQRTEGSRCRTSPLSPAGLFRRLPKGDFTAGSPGKPGVPNINKIFSGILHFFLDFFQKYGIMKL
jgi:hypothetical protein